jgi:hypothetical protein
MLGSSAFLRCEPVPVLRETALKPQAAKDQRPTFEDDLRGFNINASPKYARLALWLFLRGFLHFYAFARPSFLQQAPIRRTNGLGKRPAPATLCQLKIRQG